jgi:hypothetical protein
VSISAQDYLGGWKSGDRRNVGAEKSNEVESSTTDAFPIDIFEHLVNVSMDSELQYHGEICKQYSPGDLKKKLQMSHDSYLLSQTSEGCAFSVRYVTPDKVIAAVRVLVGCASLEHIPMRLAVHGKVRETKASTRRWYEFFFTDEEILQISGMEGCVISMSQSIEPGNPPLIDAIEIYAKPRAEVDSGSDGRLRPVPVDALSSSRSDTRPLLKVLSLLDMTASILAASAVIPKGKEDASEEIAEVAPRRSKAAKVNRSKDELASEHEKNTRRPPDCVRIHWGRTAGSQRGHAHFL